MPCFPGSRSQQLPSSCCRRQELEIKLDFEVVDGIDKLSRMDILEEITDQTTMYKVPLGC